VIAGQYTAPEPLKIEVTMFDDLTYTFSGPTYAVNIIDSSSLTNKMKLALSNSAYNTTLSPEMFIPLKFFFYNDSPFSKTHQVMEYTIGTGYEVVQV
jgi:hypothetical protein